MHTAAPTNYLADRNPFSLSPPPAWWLQGLAAFDPDLVIIPSRARPLYLLARRRRLSRGLVAGSWERQVQLDDPANVAPSRVCDDYACVYVTTLMVTGGSWTSANLGVLLEALRRRDTWTAPGGGPLDEAGMRTAMFEGGSALAKQLDAADDADKARTDRAVREDLYHATGDAWRSRQARLGERVLNAGRVNRRIAMPAPPPSRREGV